MSEKRNECSRGIPSFARKLVFVVSILACVTLAMPTTMHAQVTTVSGLGQPRMVSPAAITVITAEDVRRGGHRSVAEVTAPDARGTRHYDRRSGRERCPSQAEWASLLMK